MRVLIHGTTRGVVLLACRASANPDVCQKRRSASLAAFEKQKGPVSCHLAGFQFIKLYVLSAAQFHVSQVLALAALSLCPVPDLALRALELAALSRTARAPVFV